MEKEFQLQPVPFIVRPPEEETVLRYRTVVKIGGKDYIMYTPGPQDSTSTLVKVNVNDC